MNSDVYRLAFVLLAGGQSSRYDGNKLLSEHPITKLPLVQHSANEVIRARDAIGSMSKHPVTVVIGKWHDSVSLQLSEAFCGLTDTPIEVIHNRQWEEGIASSIRSGLSHLLSLASRPETSLSKPIQLEAASLDTKPSHVLFTLADLPSLNTQDLIRLIDASKAYPNHIVCSEWQKHGVKDGQRDGQKDGQKDGKPNSRLTVPAIFPEAMFSELLALQGDTGAKPIIKKYAKLGKVKAVSIPNAQFDIDTPQDWENVKKPD
ncbi:nucleotidyltransferase family protein [Alteromonas sp. PRIM-21]|uniref:nucleotidyltransferase family protein n=1 Tax=Alteromonas sp. PRIM-21 TaxID=1454978 RepID=UPI0022B99788|nr:nucleotidyltransferase family protein [Alteromonas sp. PRIM-21]MCZ8529138.1 nucleotidyltransferase family protein [Alteromonas sp. PRIM-21]